jgi:hypothetical protein
MQHTEHGESLKSRLKLFVYVFFSQRTNSTLLLSPPWAAPVRSGCYVLRAQFMANIIWQYVQSNPAFVDDRNGRSA